MRRWLLVVLVVSACKKSPTCDDVVPRLVDGVVTDSVLKSARAGGDAPAGVERESAKMAGEIGGPIKTNLVKACRDDRWSAEALACLAGAKDAPALQACEAKLTEDQRNHAELAVRGALAQGGAAASPYCKRYADLEIQCGKAKDGARPTIHQFCEKARAGDPDVTYRLIALESGCAQTAADCDAYKQCIEQKKRETTP